MKFSDIFKSSFMENITAVSPYDTAITLFLAFGVGVFIFLIYKKTFSGVMYSSSFGVTLILLTMITSLVILAVTSNVVLSLGMVGALSIVRFRTAIKDPLDIAFLFWSLAAGIVLAAGMILLAIMGSVIIGIVVLIFANRSPQITPYILVITCDNKSTQDEAMKLIKQNTEKFSLKSKTARKGLVEINLEVILKKDNTDFINALSEIDGVTNAVLVSYNGEYSG